MKSALFLGVAILFEVFGSTMLKLSNGFTVLLPSIGVVIGFVMSFILLGLALREIALSTAYAIWSGLGTALTACIGFIIFFEKMSVLKVVALLLIIFGVVILNKSKETDNTHQQEITVKRTKDKASIVN